MKTFSTPQKETVQTALNQLWYTHYTRNISQDERNALAEDFAEQYLVTPQFNPQESFVIHPATAKKHAPRVTVGEVLADFILRALVEGEKQQDYTVLNPDKQVRQQGQRKDRELSIVFDGEYEEDDSGEGIKKPPYSVLESEIPAQWLPRVTSVEQYHAELQRVKEYADFYATTYAEERGIAKSDILRNIRRLDLERVRKCNVCGNAFYAHDLRRYTCDQQHGINKNGERSDLSACERISKTGADLQRYHESREII